MLRIGSACIIIALGCLALVCPAGGAAPDETPFAVPMVSSSQEPNETCVILMLKDGNAFVTADQLARLSGADLEKRRAVEQELRKTGCPLDVGLYTLAVDEEPTEKCSAISVHETVVAEVRYVSKDTLRVFVRPRLRAPAKLTVAPMFYWPDGTLPPAPPATTPTLVVQIGYYPEEWKRTRWSYSFEPQWGSLGTPQSPSMRIDVRSGGRYEANTDSFTREETTLTGNVPWGQPSDVASDTTADASEKVADYLELVYERRTWQKDRGVTSFHAVARSTGRLKGPEVVVQYQPLSLLSQDNHAYFGIGLEGGWRKGDDEFEDPSTPAPERGNLVARAFGVVEWAPEIGPVNRDLSRGARLFFRGRAWADTAKDDEGDWGVRLAGFLDAELLWNFDSEHRVFLRYEAGSLPPDLTERVGRFSVGTGTAF